MRRERHIAALLAGCTVLLVQKVESWPEVHQPTERRLEWDVSIAKCIELQHPCVMYGQRSTIDGRFGLSSYYPETIELPPVGKTIRVAIYRGSESVPIIVDWYDAEHDTVLTGGAQSLFDVMSQRVSFDGYDSIRSSFSARRADGLRFPAASYVLRVDLGQLLAEIQLPVGLPRTGAGIPSQSWRFEIRQPQTATDWANYHRLEAGFLVGKRRVEEALPHLEAWVQLSRQDRFALTELGNVYSELGRPADATRVLERAYPMILRDPEKRRRDAFAALLTKNYLRLKDEVNARRVLRLSGASDTEATAILERLRRQP